MNDRPLNIYVASSWRNGQQPSVVRSLREAGHDVYDFRNPSEGDRGFHWSDIDPKWQQWTPVQFRKAIKHPIAVHGFDTDYRAMVEADMCVIVNPCGRSAHLEAGHFAGQGKPTCVLLADGEPELMYRMFSYVAITLIEVVEFASTVKGPAPDQADG